MQHNSVELSKYVIHVVN